MGEAISLEHLIDSPFPVSAILSLLRITPLCPLSTELTAD